MVGENLRLDSLVLNNNKTSKTNGTSIEEFSQSAGKLCAGMASGPGEERWWEVMNS